MSETKRKCCELKASEIKTENVNGMIWFDPPLCNDCYKEKIKI